MRSNVNNDKRFMGNQNTPEPARRAHQIRQRERYQESDAVRCEVSRRKLLEALEERGYSRDQLEDLRVMLKGEGSDLYDVLAHIAYTAPLVVRAARAERVKVEMASYDAAQQEFLNFVLDQYVRSGSDELDDQKLGDLLQLKYDALADAKEALGDVATIRSLFIELQEHLYAPLAG